MNNSPYKSPLTEQLDTQSDATSVKPWIRTLANILGFFQLVVGIIGFVGIILFLVEPSDNPSRYQFLFLAGWAFVVAVPLLLVAAICYRRCRDQMSLTERWLLIIGSALPLIAFAVANAVSLLM